SGRLATVGIIQPATFHWPLASTQFASQDLIVPFEGFEDGLTGRLKCREAAGGASFLRAERPGVSGDGVAAQPAPKLQPDRSHANQHLVITHYPLVLERD